MRTRSALSVAALCLSPALLLAGCGGGDAKSDASPAAPASSTAASSAPSASPSASASAKQSKVPASTDLTKIKVSGAYGKAPKVSVPAPWAINKTQTTVLKASNGTKIQPGSSVEVNYYGVNGRTGKRFDDSYSRGQTATFSLSQVVPGFSKGLTGQRQGSRVLVAMPGSDGYDPSGGSPQAGIQVGDSLIFVVDLVGAPLAGPQGAKVAPKPGLPTVTDTKGVPAITIGKAPAPKTLQVQPLIKGSGKKVGAGDAVTFDYLWVAYKDGRLIEQSYKTKPVSLPVSQMLKGMQKGLVNQTVGSRVLLVIPPADGYSQGNAQMKVAKGESMVMVVDLLFTQPAAG